MSIGMGNEGGLQIGKVEVVATSNTGLSIEHWTERMLDKIITVGNQTHPLIADQANAFKDDIRRILYAYLEKAIKSDRTTLYNEFLKQGEPQMAEILRRL